MNKDRIYIAVSTFSQTSPKPLSLLRDSGFHFDMNVSGKRLTKEEVISQLKDCTAVVAGLEPYDATVLHALPELRAISRVGVGIDNIDLSVAQQKKIQVFNTPDAVVQPVAELTIALIFDLLRNVTVHATLMKAHQWEKKTGQQLAEKTIGIIGLGRIGRKVAELLQCLECHIIATDVKPDMAWANARGINILDLNLLLQQSDVISLHVTHTEGQAFHLDKAHFAMMKRGAFLVNTARGSLINENDLCVALTDGTLAGAALDVFECEPYAGPLCDLPNVILSPHVATLTIESRETMETEAVLNLIKFLKQ